MKIRIEKVKVMDGKIKIEFGSVLGKAKSDWSEFSTWRMVESHNAYNGLGPFAASFPGAGFLRLATP